MLESIAEKITQNNVGKIQKLELIGFDIDPTAIKEANDRLDETRYRIGNEVELDVNLTMEDYFLRASTPVQADICVTNPPWVTLKATREIASPNLSYVNLLNELYPETTGTQRFAINLARVGFAAAARSVHKGGLLGIVIPLSMLSDIASENLRKQFLKEQTIERVETYPSELKLFSGVDQDFCTIVSRAQSSPDSPLNIVRNMRNGESSVEYYTSDEAFELFGSSYRIPDLIGKEANFQLKQFKSFPPLAAHTHVRIFREIDETRVTDRFTKESDWKFIKGKLMKRYTIDLQALPNIFLESPQRFKGLHSPKVVWRDVARRSQHRRIHAAVVPPRIIAGNSLGCLSADNLGSSALYYYLGLLNSWSTEFQVRALSNTNHVSTSIVKLLRFPEFDSGDKLHISLVESVKKQIASTSDEHQEAVESAVLKVLGLNYDQLNIMKVGLDRA